MARTNKPAAQANPQPAKRKDTPKPAVAAPVSIPTATAAVVAAQATPVAKVVPIVPHHVTEQRFIEVLSAGTGTMPVSFVETLISSLKDDENFVHQCADGAVHTLANIRDAWAESIKSGVLELKGQEKRSVLPETANAEYKMAVDKWETAQAMRSYFRSIFGALKHAGLGVEEIRGKGILAAYKLGQRMLMDKGIDYRGRDSEKKQQQAKAKEARALLTQAVKAAADDGVVFYALERDAQAEYVKRAEDMVKDADNTRRFKKLAEAASAKADDKEIQANLAKLADRVAGDAARLVKALGMDGARKYASELATLLERQAGLLQGEAAPM